MWGSGGLPPAGSGAAPRRPTTLIYSSPARGLLQNPENRIPARGLLQNPEN